jgi:hypothetical protein
MLHAVLLLGAAIYLAFVAQALFARLTSPAGLGRAILGGDLGIVSLAQAKLNTQDDLDANVIDEFRKSSVILDSLLFHDAVNPMGGGSTLTYGYHRVTAQRAAAFRAVNSEYVPAEASKARFTTDLKPLGGSFEIDRVLAQIARAGEVSFQMTQLIKATTTKFADEVINGDVAVDANGFDGLDKALTGSTTELIPNSGTTGYADWTDLDTAGNAQKALDLFDEFLGLLDGTPTLVLGTAKALAKLRAIGRRANLYVVAPVDGLVDTFGNPIERQRFGNVTITDPGDKAGSTNPIIPIETRDPDGAGPGGNITGLTDIFAVRIALDGFHGVSVAGQPLVKTWLPDFERAGAVKPGEVEMGPVTVALKATKSAAVLRNIKVQ